MSGLRIAIIGTGKMGRAVRTAALENGDAVVAALGRDTRVTRESLRDADVAIEFTEPSEAPANVRACIDASCPVVVGTTGWYDVLPEITRYAMERGGAVLWGPNFSLGMLAFARLVREAAALAPLAGFDAHIIETHHAAKRDAPSGTARMLAGTWKATGRGAVPMTSVRVGSVPGTHELVLDARNEQIVLRHEVRDRRVFADGALAAAHWLAGRAGVYTLEDIFTAHGETTNA